ncbi:hypothetical protein EYF80_044014 [Liparis tanakae]|uniref:Uncharacterized protein n=1 Tax=Liparis tanakae TaxID=230148 RepID=A0A4Z2FZ18_9TELE|nr:hypothetical protein EYF80_044014 [Liparis tanakae]
MMHLRLNPSPRAEGTTALVLLLYRIILPTRLHASPGRHSPRRLTFSFFLILSCSFTSSIVMWGLLQRKK